MYLIRKLIENDYSDQEDFASALSELERFLNTYHGPLENIEFTPYRLAEIFGKHVESASSIAILISALCNKEPTVLVADYYYEEDEETVDLTPEDVYAYITKKCSKSPVSGLDVESIEDYIFVIYHLSDKALLND